MSKKLKASSSTFLLLTFYSRSHKDESHRLNLTTHYSLTHYSLLSTHNSALTTQHFK
ncbi:hypothetical protein [Nostoc sp. CMAA1605]|uniref:hypothetical protein n=1 Tax=Nostoc sp. CMAA1605 TaxID=2055159 RepID=UPI001F2B0B49|nr:hypothetical protein [Nostoc sp. CMAA1605]